MTVLSRTATSVKTPPRVGTFWDSAGVEATAIKWVDGPSMPLVARGLLLALCAALATVLFGPTLAAGPALSLLVVAALASLPMPASVPRGLAPICEAAVVAALIGSLGERGAPFLAYLLAPTLAAGLTAGLLGAVAASLLSTTSLVLGTVSRGGSDVAGGLASDLQWAAIVLAVGAMGAWVRRIRSERPVTSEEPAYADAHRLLSELHTVARNLSLGLDPATLGSALVQEMRSLVDARAIVLLVRSPSGRFVPLVGKDDGDESVHDEHVVLDAWLAAEPRSTRARGRTILALPIKMGERVVAALVVVVDGAPGDLERRCRDTVERAGPRLASAMLFDDVRRLATTDERLRVARDIHDGVAQELASIGYVLDDVATRVDSDVAADLLRLRHHVREVTAELRLSIFDLRTGVDDAVGLGTAVSEHAQRLGSQSGMVVHVVMDEGQHRLPVGTEVELLRIAQEALTNVRRHAGASTLWVEVSTAAPGAVLRISDDGQGMGTARPDSMGIKGMRERARRIGADLRIGARDGGGTVVEVVLGATGRSTADELVEMEA